MHNLCSVAPIVHILGCFSSPKIPGHFPQVALPYCLPIVILIAMKRISQRGFTLIELLVVIAIIGLLSSVVLASLNTARAKARDARRLSDMRQFSIALQLYFDDNLHYPGTAEGIPSTGAVLGDTTDASSLAFATALKPYMSSIPADPLYQQGLLTGQSYYYSYDFSHCMPNSAPLAAILAFHTREAAGPTIPKATDCGSDMGQNAAVYSVAFSPAGS